MSGRTASRRARGGGRGGGRGRPRPHRGGPQSPPLPSPPFEMKLIDTVPKAVDALATVKVSLPTDPGVMKAVGIDLEGDLDPTKRASLLQLSTGPTLSGGATVFLFDIWVCPEVMSPLAPLLAGDGGWSDVVKVLHDLRRDSAALYGQFGVQLGGKCFDSQVADKLITGTKQRRGLNGVLEKYLGAAEVNPLKDKVHHRSGLWEQRPLPELQLQYSAYDTVKLVPLLYAMMISCNTVDVLQRTDQEIKSQISQVTRGAPPAPSPATVAAVGLYEHLKRTKELAKLQTKNHLRRAYLKWWQSHRKSSKVGKDVGFGAVYVAMSKSEHQELRKLTKRLDAGSKRASTDRQRLAGRASSSSVKYSRDKFAVRFKHLLAYDKLQAKVELKEPSTGKVATLFGRKFQLVGKKKPKLEFMPYDMGTKRWSKPPQQVPLAQVLCVAEPDYNDAWTAALSRHHNEIQPLRRMADKCKLLISNLAAESAYLPPYGPPPGGGGAGQEPEQSDLTEDDLTVPVSASANLFEMLTIDDDDDDDALNSSGEDATVHLATTFTSKDGYSPGVQQLRYLHRIVECTISEALGLEALQLRNDDFILMASTMEEAFGQVLSTLKATDAWRAMQEHADQNGEHLNDQHDADRLSELLEALDVVSYNLRQHRDKAVERCERKLMELEMIREKIRQRRMHMGEMQRTAHPPRNEFRKSLAESIRDVEQAKSRLQVLEC